MSRSGFTTVVTAIPLSLGVALRAEKPRPGGSRGRAVKTCETTSKKKPFGWWGGFLLLLTLPWQGCSLAPVVSLPPVLEKKAPPIPVRPYRGVFHVHTHYSHDSLGSLDEVLRAARKRGLDFVVVTDHNTLQGKWDYEKKKTPRAPLLIFGNEISTREGHLIALGLKEKIKPPLGAQEAIKRIHALGGYAVLAHPVCRKGPWKDWQVEGFDGLEIYNYACDFYRSNKGVFLFKSLLLPPSFFIRQTVLEPRESLKQWDSLNSQAPLPAFGAVDAHPRFSLFGFPLLRYSLLLRAVTMYVFADSFSEEEILKALFAGKSFIAFESRGHAQDFSFKQDAPDRLKVSLPKRAEIRIFRNGNLVAKKRAQSFVYPVKEPGTYRVEVFRNGKLWILSNPILVQV